MNNQKRYDLDAMSSSADSTQTGGTMPPSGIAAISAQISDIQAKIQKVNETVDLYKKELDYINPRFETVNGRVCKKRGKSYRGWVDVSGVYWCADDSDRGNKSATANKTTYDNYIASAPNLLKGYEAQLLTLQASLDKLSQSDPAVIQAQGAAQAALQSAKSKSNTWKIIGISVAGVILIVGIVYAIKKFKSKA